MEEMEVGTIGNYYGGLNIKKDGEKFYWSIENYDGDEWEEIPEYLYESIVKFEKDRRKRHLLSLKEAA